MPHHPVFIVGSPRSGTTALVDVLLAAGYRGYREGQFLSLIGGIDRVIRQHMANFAHASSKILLAHIDEAALRRRLHGIIKEIAEGLNPVAPWFDKTATLPMIEALPTVLELWPEAAVIFAQRRGIENVQSRLRKFPQRSFEAHCEDWARIMAAWRRTRDGLAAGRFVEIEQQDMVHRPGPTAARLAAFLSLDDVAERRMAAILARNRPQETDAGTAGRVLSLDDGGWTADRIRTFDAACGAEMRAFGYARDASYRCAPEDHPGG